MNFFTEDKNEWKQIREGFEKTLIFKNIKAMRCISSIAEIFALIMLVMGEFEFDLGNDMILGIQTNAWIVALLGVSICTVLLYGINYFFMMNYANTIKKTKKND